MYKSTPVVNGLQKIDSAALEYLMRSHTGYWGQNKMKKILER